MLTDIDVNTYLTRITLVSKTQEAEQRVFLVLGTLKRSRWKRYEFGCYLHNHLFDPVNSDTANDIRREIEDSFIDPYNGLDDIVLGPVTVIPDVPNQQYYVEFEITVDGVSDTIRYNLARQ